MVFTSPQAIVDPQSWNQGGDEGRGIEMGVMRLEAPMLMAERARMAKVPIQPETALNCPRCDSANTKFCYFNNYSLSQPRHFCRTCRRYWTRGGALRNVPVGGGCRRNKRSKAKASAATGSHSSSVSSGGAIASPVSHLPFLPTLPDYGGQSFAGMPFMGAFGSYHQGYMMPAATMFPFEDGQPSDTQLVKMEDNHLARNFMGDQYWAGAWGLDFSGNIL